MMKPARASAVALLLGAMLCLAATARLSANGADTAASLTINVTGLKSTTGSLMIALFDSESSYMDGKTPMRGFKLDASGSSPSAMLDLAPGRYAIKAYHDVNGNGKLDMNPFGAPTEPVAFSNNAHVHMGPPSWKEASFEVHAGSNTQVLSME